MRFIFANAGYHKYWNAQITIRQLFFVIVRLVEVCIATGQHVPAWRACFDGKLCIYRKQAQPSLCAILFICDVSTARVCKNNKELQEPERMPLSGCSWRLLVAMLFNWKSVEYNSFAVITPLYVKIKCQQRCDVFHMHFWCSAMFSVCMLAACCINFSLTVFDVYQLLQISNLIRYR